VPPTEHADVVIVGGGLLGLSTAYALRDTRAVVVLERETIGYTRAGSHGPSRIFRLGYADQNYVALAQQALRAWTALEADTGTMLLHACGQLSFGPGAEDVHRALMAADAPVERLSEADVAERYPRFAGHGAAVFEPASAVIAADTVLATLRTHARADVRERTRVLAVDEHGVTTSAGRIDARTVVVCAGPWTRALVPAVDTRATLEHVGYVEIDERLPIFVDFRVPTIYGLPTPDQSTYKIAVHHGGHLVDPEEPFTPDPAAVAQLHVAVERWLPGTELVDVDMCPYDNTDDEHFIVQRIDGVIVGAGTSGHAFKFGPVLGEQIAALVAER
jgi:sarcosine oxidase